MSDLSDRLRELAKTSASAYVSLATVLAALEAEVARLTARLGPVGGGHAMDERTVRAQQQRTAETVQYGEAERGRESYEQQILRLEAEVARLTAELEQWKGANLYPATYRDAVEKLRQTEALATQLAAALFSLSRESHAVGGVPELFSREADAALAAAEAAGIEGTP